MEPFWEKMGLSTEPQMWRASELLDCLRQHRQDGILIYFFYQDAAYEVGVRKEDGKTVFFLNDDSYPSMLAFCSSANIEGILLSDLLDPIAVFSVNGKHRKQNSNRTKKEDEHSNESPSSFCICAMCNRFNQN